MCWVLARLPCLGFSVHATNTQLPSAMATIPMGVNVIRGVSTIDPAGEFIEQSSSGVNSCCPERFLLWEKAEEESSVVASPAVYCGSRRNRPCGARRVPAGQPLHAEA